MSDVIEIDIPTIRKTIELKKARILIRQVHLFDCAMLDVRLLDEDGTVWKCLTFRISDQEYREWTNDQYLIDWVKNKLQNLN
jgi:hypothetical protein